MYVEDTKRSKTPVIINQQVIIHQSKHNNLELINGDTIAKSVIYFTNLKKM